MSKLPITLEIEKKLISKHSKTSDRYALEVPVDTTLIADFVTANYSYEYGYPLITVYEIKVTISDFKSKHGHNFYGDLNYYVIPKELFDEILKKNALLLGRDVGIYTYSKGKFYLQREQRPNFFYAKQRLRIDERFKIFDAILMRWTKGSMRGISPILEQKYERLKQNYSVLKKYYLNRTDDKGTKALLERLEDLWKV